MSKISINRAKIAKFLPIGQKIIKFFPIGQKIAKYFFPQCN
jgi:hypothetical protein